MTDNTGEHFYIGPSFGAGANLSYTRSEESMTEGLNASGSGTGIVSVSVFPSGSIETGFGAGLSVGGSVFWVFK